ncbi:MAG TPA: YciI family protein, partial [Thermoleophilaceae bacterium]|nr:YciI family protein [Thermoleophilaceae bacterium]
PQEVRPMKYLLALFGDESGWGDRTPEQQAEAMKAWDAFTNSAIEAGVHLGGEGLQPSATATCVRIQESGDPVLSDGPFVETKEQLGGYYLLDCKDLDDALSWAKRIPMPGGTVEVRPVMDYEAIGSEAHSNTAEAAR